jgi:hypothetical protein
MQVSTTPFMEAIYFDGVSKFTKMKFSPNAFLIAKVVEFSY